VLSLLLSACHYEFEPPDREARIVEAGERLTPALFDTVQWVNDSIRALDGNETYAAKCRRCHGTFGEGATEYALSRDLVVPSLVEPDWPLADSLGATRRLIFTGHSGGMPTWGVAGITPRQIDASAYYVLFQLRPDVLEGTGGP
jgi:mono/diheme cytochrome c family protein